MGAACHSGSSSRYASSLGHLVAIALNHFTQPLSNRPSHVLLSCGVPEEAAANAVRLSVGRETTEADVDAAVADLKDAVQLIRSTLGSSVTNESNS